jgi:hypothetical protein
VERTPIRHGLMTYVSGTTMRGDHPGVEDREPYSFRNTGPIGDGRLVAALLDYGVADLLA